MENEVPLRIKQREKKPLQTIFEDHHHETIFEGQDFRILQQLEKWRSQFEERNQRSDASEEWNQWIEWTEAQEENTVSDENPASEEEIALEAIPEIDKAKKPVLNWDNVTFRNRRPISKTRGSSEFPVRPNEMSLNPFIGDLAGLGDRSF